MKKSAGLLLFRKGAAGLEVLLAHQGGPFWARKDEGAWTIPKGEFADGEDPLSAARREFAEETGSAPAGDFLELKPVRTANKLLFAWALQSDFDVGVLKSNTFGIEWPPRSGRLREYPEIDRAEWLPLETARRKILKGQAPFLDELVERLHSAAG